MNLIPETTVTTSGNLVYQPHRLQLSGCAPSSDGVRAVGILETIGERYSVTTQEVEDSVPIEVLAPW